MVPAAVQHWAVAAMAVVAAAAAAEVAAAVSDEGTYIIILANDFVLNNYTQFHI